MFVRLFALAWFIHKLAAPWEIYHAGRKPVLSHIYATSRWPGGWWTVKVSKDRHSGQHRFW